LNSSQLDKQAIEHPELKRFYGVLGYSINDWYETEIFDENLDSILKYLRLLYITGGEPTLIKKNFELLEKLINEGYSKNIWLSINSNLTNDKTTFFDLISEFRNVTFSASIDGYRNIQEYLRYPSNWEQIDKNIHRLVDRKANNIDIRIQPVVQIGNLGSITELFEYAESFNRVADKLVVNLYLNILENPNYLDLLYLPLEYKIECWNRIETWVKDKCKYQLPIFHSQLEALKNKCFTDIDYKKTLTTFFEFNELLDNVQHIKLVDVNPELYSLKSKYLGENNE
jgi:sulfatase maturation enzyme AslB (radical SAM superfamily)